MGKAKQAPVTAEVTDTSITALVVAAPDNLQVVELTLDEAREAYVKNTADTQSAKHNYAEALTRQFGVGWWDIPMKGPLASNNMSATRDAIRAEKKKHTEMCKARGLANPWKPWSDMLAYVKGEKKGAKPNTPRDILVRVEAEVTPVYKAVVHHDDAETEKLLNISFHLGKVLLELGVELEPLQPKR